MLYSGSLISRSGHLPHAKSVSSISLKTLAFTALISTSLTSVQSFAIDMDGFVEVNHGNAPRQEASFLWRHGRNYFQGAAQKIIDEQSPKLGAEAARRARQRIYKTPGVHVEDYNGNNIGVVVADNSQLIRNFSRSVLNIDLAEAIPGPSFVGNAVLNLIENYARDVATTQFTEQVGQLAAEGAKRMLCGAFNIAEAYVHSAPTVEVDIEEATIRAELQAQIEAEAEDEARTDAMRKALDMEVGEDDGLVTSVTKYVRQFFTQFKLWVAEQIQDAIASVGNHYISLVADQLHEKGLRVAEVATGTIATTTAGLAAGPVGMFVAGAVPLADAYIADGENSSYLRTAINWLTGAEKKKEAVKLKGQWLSLNFANNLMHRIGLVSQTDEAYALNQTQTVVDPDSELENDNGFVMVDETGFKMPSLTPVISKFTAAANDLYNRAAEAAHAASEVGGDLLSAADEFFNAMHGFDEEDSTHTDSPSKDTQQPEIDHEEPWKLYIDDSLAEPSDLRPSGSSWTSWFGF